MVTQARPGMTVKVYGRLMVVWQVVDGWTIMRHSMYRTTSVCAKCMTLLTDDHHQCA